jgi:hypothetical protein
MVHYWSSGTDLAIDFTVKNLGHDPATERYNVMGPVREKLKNDLNIWHAVERMGRFQTVCVQLFGILFNEAGVDKKKATEAPVLIYTV